ncbi:hypothetical protein [Bartonella sp. WD16.2]|uniref:hypothetical protein n=1 Tax=Bartonella sp. WD16.2 TaxID=1933904 RepID=UPI0018864077|nr:hypothetical protein [Bartonella sp. WD16.2]
MTKQQEMVALRAYDQLQELFAVKADGEVIAEAMRIFSCGLKISQNSDEEGMSLAYGMALEGVSSWVLQTATKGALKGKAEGLTRPLCHQQQIFIITVKNLNTVFAQGLVVFLKIFKSLS